jgi:hypothetical protein
LIEFALNTNMIYRAIAAVKKVDDISRIPQSTLATIIAAVSWTDFDNKIGAIADKITDQAELFRVATTASLKPVRQAALCRLADVELLCKFIVSIAEGLKDKYEPNRLEAESLLKYIYWKRKESLVRQQIASYNGTLVEEAGEDEGEWDSQCGEDYYYITQKGSPARYFRVP